MFANDKFLGIEENRTTNKQHKDQGKQINVFVFNLQPKMSTMTDWGSVRARCRTNTTVENKSAMLKFVYSLSMEILIIAKYCLHLKIRAIQHQ